MTAIAYHLTFRPYGTWLPGDPRGSVDAKHSGYRVPHRPPDPSLTYLSRRAVMAPPVLFDDRARRVAAAELRDVAAFRAWWLHALHVGVEHVHVVVTAAEAPLRVVGTFKARATRRLREAGCVQRDARVWASGASARHIFTAEGLARAIAYVEGHVAEGRGGRRAAQLG